MRRTHLPAAATTVACVLAVTACGEKAVKKSEVESSIKDRLTQQVGKAPKDIQCPDDLKAKKGEKMTCTLVAPNGDKVDVFVTVASVSGGTARYNLRVGNKIR